MPKRLLVVVAFALVVAPIPAQDGLPPAVVDAVKKASAFIRVEGQGWSASGSGFVVGGDEKALLVATNHHVIEGRGGKAGTVTVVFDSGTKTERSFPAAVAASDPDRDLAILRLTGVKSPPAAIGFADATKLTETMPVYSFGFPFGKALAEDAKSPAVTVGKASVSSLRNGPDGGLATIQIDGNLNPGNSGGPVVDAKGKLVGVAVATLKEGQGIGFIIPAKEVGLMLQGRVGRVKVTPVKGTDGKFTGKLEATLVDPSGSVRTATARYVVVPPKGKRPDGDNLAKASGSKTVELKIANGVATGEVPLADPNGELLVQVSLETSGRQTLTAKMQAVALTSASAGGPPPSGWKEFSPADRTFVMWVPEKPARQSEGTRVKTLNGRTVFISTLTGGTADGLSYEAQAILLPVFFADTPRKELAEVFRDALAKDMGGRVTQTTEVKAGSHTGYESVVEARGESARVRVFVSEIGGVYIAVVSGTARQVAGAEATTLLSAFRPADPNAPQLAAPAPAPGPKANPNAATIYGGGNDPVFTDKVPDGGWLVGFEVGTAAAFGRNMTRAIRPIYKVKQNTLYGDQQGTQLDEVVTLKAKDGYAVGAVSVMHGLGFDGIRVTFMKIAGDKLDPKDSYQSEYVGSDEKKALTEIGGDGTPIVGVVGRSNDKDLTGFGLLLKGQDTPK